MKLLQQLGTLRITPKRYTKATTTTVMIFDVIDSIDDSATDVRESVLVLSK
jgi:hypothetical protein